MKKNHIAIWSTVGAVLAFSAIAFAATTISTDIVTGGNLNVTGTATLQNLTVNGAAAFNGGLSADIIPLQDTASNLSSVVASSGQMIYETDTKYSKAGDGVTALGSILPIGFWKSNSPNIYFGSGKVGIGTTSPVSMLSVGGDITATGTIYMASPGTGNGIDYDPAIVSQGVANIMTFLSLNNAAGDPTYWDLESANGTSDGTMNFFIGNTLDGQHNINYMMSGDGTISITASQGVILNGMHILVGGQVGIGTTSPVADFQAAEGSANSTTTIELGKKFQNKGTCIKVYRYDGTALYISYNNANAQVISTTPCASVTGF